MSTEEKPKKKLLETKAKRYPANKLAKSPQNGSGNWNNNYYFKLLVPYLPLKTVIIH